MKTNIREKYRRFRAWQKNPFDYEMHEEATQHCQNCGYEFTGNYCPRCSQKAGLGALTWRSVREGVMEIWGVGTRSMTYSIWQLFTRPGYLIHDYVTGKRQVSFPPVKMLLIVAFIATIVQNFLFPEKSTPLKSVDNTDAIDLFIIWTADNQGWGILAIRSFLILPNWILYRYAPRLAEHSLPQGFFIQVFMCVQTVIINILLDYSIYYLALLFLIYIWTYMQLFGFNFWSTLWRSSLALISVLMTAGFFVFLIVGPESPEKASVMEGWKLFGLYFSVFIFFALGILFPLVIGYAINKWTHKKHV